MEVGRERVEGRRKRFGFSFVVIFVEISVYVRFFFRFSCGTFCVLFIWDGFSVCKVVFYFF